MNIVGCSFETRFGSVSYKCNKKKQLKKAAFISC